MKVIATYIVETWEGKTLLYETEGGKWYIQKISEDDHGRFLEVRLREISADSASYYLTRDEPKINKP
jgi:hypothetical protein